MQSPPLDWTQFLQRSVPHVDPAALAPLFRNKVVLITGGGGFLGSALARQLGTLGVARIVLLDSAEHGLHDCMQDEALASLALPVVGDVCDALLMHEIMTAYRPHIVFHAAAAKHVWLMERNPFTAARTNILGTSVALAAAHDCGAEQFLLLSTDKAVEPVSIMGATKRVAELQVLASRGPTAAKAVRLGNVLGSTGSIVPTVQHQAAQGRAVTITDASCERYFLSPQEATLYLLGACSVQVRETILVADAGRPRNIMELVALLLQDDAGSLPIHYCGLRSGEKQCEQMYGAAERLQASLWPGLQLARGLGAETLHLEELFAAIGKRDASALLASIMKLVPAYTPGAELAAFARTQVFA